MKKANWSYWVKSAICAVAIVAALGLPSWADQDGTERFPINDDVDVYVPETPNGSNQRLKATDTPVSAEVKALIKASLRELYAAYKDKDVDKVLLMLHDCIESSALEYAQRHPENPQAAEEIRDAYKIFHIDVFNNKDYVLDPFTLEFCQYRTLENGNIEVSSAVPIISSKSMDFVEETVDQIHYLTISLRLGRFVYAHGDKGWHIVEMDLF